MRRIDDSLMATISVTITNLINNWYSCEDEEFNKVLGINELNFDMEHKSEDGRVVIPGVTARTGEELRVRLKKMTNKE